MAATQRHPQGSTPSAPTTTKPSLQDQLDKAEAGILKTRNATATLHYWWRQHLFRLSLLIFLLCFNQARKPSAECIKNIKIINEGIGQYNGFEAAHLILNDSVVEIMGLIMMAALSYFLAQADKPITFSDQYYMIATGLIPLQVAAYFQNQKMGCAHLVDGAEPLDRDFPISMVFHTIVTICCWFMNYQMQLRNDEVKAVADMRRTLASAERKAAETETKMKSDSKKN